MLPVWVPVSATALHGVISEGGMSSFTFDSVADVFPVGTTVGAYLVRQRTQGAPTGIASTTGAVQANGSLTLDGLAEMQQYVAYAQVAGVHRYRAFTAPEDPDPPLGSYQGPWNVIQSYEPLEIVLYQGSLYMTSTGVAAGGVSPDRNSAWSIFSPGMVVLDVRTFGALGVESVNDQAAIQAAITYAKTSTDCPNGAIILFPIPRVSYRVDSELDCYLPASAGRRLIFMGQEGGSFITTIRPNFAGRGKALFRCVDTAKDATGPNAGIEHWRLASAARHAPVHFFNLYLRHYSQAVAHPVLVWVHGAGEHRSYNLRFGGTNNVAWRANGTQNFRNEDCYLAFGGKSWVYKPSDGVTFSCDGTNVITSSVPFFDAADYVAGGDARMKRRVFWLHRYADDSQRYWFRVTGYIDSTHIQVDQAGPITAAWDAPPGGSAGTGRGHFEDARLAIAYDPAHPRAAGTTTTATVDGAGCFVNDDIGTRLWVHRPAGNTFFATIASITNSHTVELVETINEVVDGAFFWTPSIEWTGWAFSTGSSSGVDVKSARLHIEGNKGPVLLKDLLQVAVTDFKWELITSPVDASRPVGMLVADDVQGFVQGEGSGSNVGRHRYFVCGQTHPLVIEKPSMRLGNREPMVFCDVITAEKNGAVFVNGPGATINKNGSPWYIVDDLNDATDPRVAIVGMLGTDANTERPRMLLGTTDRYIDMQGNLVGVKQAAVTNGVKTIATAALADLPALLQRMFNGRLRLDAATAATRNVDEAVTTGSTNTNGGAGLCPFYLDPADYAVSGKTVKLRLRVSVLVNATAPACDFTVELVPLNAVGGSAANVSISTLAAVTGSSVVVAAPAAAAKVVAAATFDCPAAGLYCVQVTNTVAMAASSAAAIRVEVDVTRA
jgi:hypothetical protein